jgi:holin-like protein
MKYLKQFTIIIVISFIAELLSRFVPFPAPASMWGILVLFGLLASKRLKLELIDETASFLIAIMVITFVVPAVGVYDAMIEYKGVFALILLVILISTISTIILTGLFAQMLIKAGRIKEGRE